MGKIHVVFLCLVILIGCGYVSKASDLSAGQNSTSSESESEDQEKFLLEVLDRLNELEQFKKDLEEFNATVPELAAKVNRINDFIIENGLTGPNVTNEESNTTTTTTTPLPGMDLTTTIHVHTDKTLEEEAKSVEVVKAVVDKIQASGIFPDDHNFLQRLAFADSQFGEDPQTFRSNFTGGIWQLTRANYEKTKASGGQLEEYHDKIYKNFDIKWADTNWNDLLKPLYSGLAARLLLATFSQSLPQVLTKQANVRRYQNLTSEIGLSKNEFMSQIKQLEANSTCTGKMDLLVILDESGSVGLYNFQKSLEFVGNLFKSYSNAPRGNVRLGFMTYSHLIRYHFHMVNSLSMNEMYSNVMSRSFASGGSSTNRAIQRGIDQFTPGKHGYTERDGVPKIIALFTDGKSGDGVSNSVKATELGITTFAVGIGKAAKLAELQQIANYDDSRVFSLKNYEALAEFFRRLNSATCTVAQTPKIGANVVDELGQDEKRVYCYAVPSEGITLSLTSSLGNVTGYFSYSYRTPSAALNDGILNRGINLIPNQNGTEAANSLAVSPLYFKKQGRREGCDVYVTIQGVGGPLNSYTVTAQNQTSTINNNTMHDENTNKNNNSSAEVGDDLDYNNSIIVD